MKTAMAVVGLVFSVAAGAKPVYKCEEGGQITFTDQPCVPGASAATLPEPVVTAPLTRAEQDLAREAEARLARERAERDQADAAWLKDYARERERAERERQKQQEKQKKERKR